jgi:hypothetical protein
MPRINFKGLQSKKARKFYSDIFAMVIFSTVVGMIVEIYISGLALLQSVQARATAAPMNIITARPYGIYRDWLFRAFKAKNASQWIKGYLDILAFVTFQVPLYASILFTTGASGKQILISCSTLLALSFIIGRPYGLFLSLFRWLFKVNDLK